MLRSVSAILAAGFLPAFAGAAAAHVTLETQQAQVAATYKAVLRVPHGCDGSPTVRLRVQIPEGVVAVKPMPKPGWQLETVRGAYAKPYDYFGKPQTEGVTAIVWIGRLADDHYDEFVFRAYLTDSLAAGQALHFPVVQDCERGANRWVDTSGGHSHGKQHGPAPVVKLVPKP